MLHVLVCTQSQHAHIYMREFKAEVHDVRDVGGGSIFSLVNLTFWLLKIMSDAKDNSFEDLSTNRQRIRKSHRMATLQV